MRYKCIFLVCMFYVICEYVCHNLYDAHFYICLSWVHIWYFNFCLSEWYMPVHYANSNTNFFIHNCYYLPQYSWQMAVLLLIMGYFDWISSINDLIFVRERICQNNMNMISNMFFRKRICQNKMNMISNKYHK